MIITSDGTTADIEGKMISYGMKSILFCPAIIQCASNSFGAATAIGLHTLKMSGHSKAVESSKLTIDFGKQFRTKKLIILGWCLP